MPVDHHGAVDAAFTAFTAVGIAASTTETHSAEHSTADLTVEVNGRLLDLNVKVAGSAANRANLMSCSPPGATAIDGAGAMVATPTGDVRVDVLEVSEEQFDDLPEDPTDRLYLLSHDWGSTFGDASACPCRRWRHHKRTYGPGR